METTRRIVFVIAISIFLFACTSPIPSPTLPVASTSESGTPILESSTPLPKSTKTITPTIWPPIVDLFRLEDIRSLDSFVITINEKNTVNGQLTEITTTIGYIREPYRAYSLRTFSGDEEKIYVVEGITYKVTNIGDWYLSGTASDDFFYVADPANLAGKLFDAQFTEQENINNMLANHFVLESTALAESNANVLLEGDFYVADDGNYILSSYWKETASQQNFEQIYEVTSELTSINLLTEITLPADFQAMKTAMNLPLELGLPLPVDSNFFGLIRYVNGVGVDTYTYTTPKTSIEEFLEYYRVLPETNGWKVSHVGHVSLHESDCEFSRECVIINKGSTQVILYYNGASIRVEFDSQHIYSPR